MNADSIDRSEGDVNVSSERLPWQHANVGDAARSTLRDDERYFFHQALSTPCLTAIAGASGSEIVDADGRRYLDFHGNGVHQIGYGHPRVLDAIRTQLDAMTFCPRRYTNAPAVELARRLADRSPWEDARALFAPGGAEAVGMALKLARLVTGRHKTISFHGAFHGATLDAISVGGEAIFRDGMGPLMPGAFHVPPPFPLEASADRTPCEQASVDAIESVMAAERDIGAVIAEPIRCTTAEKPSPEYWQRVRERCTAHGALLIFDEIPLCLGRTGTWFSFEHFDVEPDVICLGKGLGGGVVPLAATIARAEYNDALRHAAIGHYTHEKNPVLCAAGVATLDVIEDENLLERSHRMGRHALQKLSALQQSHAAVGEVRGTGLLLAATLQGADADVLAERAMYAALERGLSFKVSAGRTLTLTPPLTITRPDLDRAIDILGDALSAVSA